MGFARDHIVSLPIFGHDFLRESNPKKRLSARHQMVKQVFLEHPNVLSASAVRYRIAGYGGRPRLIWPDGDRTRERTIPINEVDDSFFETFEIPVLRGRAFSAAVASDTSQAIILNETAVRLLGWQDDPIGKQIESPAFKNQAVTVIGVVKDYHSSSLREEIAPLGFIARWRFFYSLVLRIRPEGTAQTLAFLETQWKRFVPEEPFEYHFMDEFMEWIYFNERRTGKMLGDVFITGDFCGMPGAVRTGGVYGSVSHQGNRRAEGTGRIHVTPGDATLARIPVAHSPCQRRRLANRLLSDARLAFRICVSDNLKCSAICRKRDTGPDHCIWNCKRTGHSRGSSQSDQCFAR